MGGAVPEPIETSSWKTFRYLQHMAIIQGLKPDCTYQVQVAANNVAGWSSFSKVLVVHTNKAAPEPLFAVQMGGASTRIKVMPGLKSSKIADQQASVVVLYAGISTVHIRVRRQTRIQQVIILIDDC